MWTKIGHELWSSPGMLSVDRDARLVHLEAMTWCNAHGTDGQVPKHAMRKITDSPDPEAAIAQLVTAGEWELNDSGWRLTQFLKDQPAAATVEQQRADAKRRKDAFNRRQGLHSSGDHSECLPYAQCRRTGDGTRSGTRSERPPVRPSDRPTAREGGRDGENERSATASAGAPTLAPREGLMPEPKANGDIGTNIGKAFELSYSEDSLYLMVRYEDLGNSEYQDAMFVLASVKRELAKSFQQIERPSLESSEIEFVVPPESAQFAWSTAMRIIRNEGTNQ